MLSSVQTDAHVNKHQTHLHINTKTKKKKKKKRHQEENIAHSRLCNW